MLAVRDLSRRFDELLAVDSVSFEVEAGRIFGLLGPNGAGKTTTISMISGLLKPSAGSVHVDGINLADNAREVKRRLGVVPQEIALYEDLTARENLNFWGGIYGLKGRPLKARVDQLLDQVGLTGRDREPVKNYSGGMKRRLNLAMGIIHEPKLILLDEPTVGIDPQARINVLEVVKEIVRGGSTILYTTHYLEEAEDLCDELAIMDNGKILAQGSIDQLKSQLGDGILVALTGEFEERQLQAALVNVPQLQPLEVGVNSALLMLPAKYSDGGVGSVLESIFASGIHFDDVSIKEPNLEDLFLKLTGRELRD